MKTIVFVWLILTCIQPLINAGCNTCYHELFFWKEQFVAHKVAVSHASIQMTKYRYPVVGTCCFVCRTHIIHLCMNCIRDISLKEFIIVSEVDVFSWSVQFLIFGVDCMVYSLLCGLTVEFIYVFDCYTVLFTTVRAGLQNSPPLHNIWVMLIVWRLRGNIIRTAVCWIV